MSDLGGRPQLTEADLAFRGETKEQLRGLLGSSGRARTLARAKLALEFQAWKPSRRVLIARLEPGEAFQTVCTERYGVVLEHDGDEVVVLLTLDGGRTEERRVFRDMVVLR